MVNTSGQLFTLFAEGVEATLDLEIGHLASFKVAVGNRELSPFHRVPWADDREHDPALPPHLRRLSIDFFCAPFGESDIEPAPAHGWPANSQWTLIGSDRLQDGVRATFRLCRTILGSTLTKTLILRDRHPFLYQSHRFEGGAGAIPIAYHAMVDLPNGGLLSTSQKRRAQTMEDVLESDSRMGHSILAYPASTDDLRQFPAADGSHVDLLRYPIGERHVDLVMLHEEPGNSLGWTVVARPAERDMAIILKPPSVLPSTVLWYSNGGRYYAPWNGRHRGVLGVEEARTFFGYGHRASLASNALSRDGIDTSFSMESSQEIRSVIGTFESPGDQPEFDSLIAQDGQLHLHRAGKKPLALPFDSKFLS